ncbi:MAG: nucleotidyltransferase family protein [Oscillospiraceae bacterium]|jgi:predicted nucleotidyltransferase|nr:nucleotidyltransferase family protein [Oscillospiraceae bacterium]
MQVVGIVAEYNPFHTGHAYQIARTRAALGEDAAVVAVMSGNWIQGGRCAAADKWTRSRLALTGGVDLVLELPTVWAVSSAENFARGAVGILAAAGVVDVLSFGSECGEVDRLRQVAACLNSPVYEAGVRRFVDEGMPFAAARQEVVRGILGPEHAELLSTPNNNLGVEYLRALDRLGSDIRPVTVRREGASHDSMLEGESLPKFLSATQIRAFLMDENWRAAEPYLPGGGAEILQKDWGGMPDLRRAERGLLTRLRTMTAGDWAAIPDSGAAEGLPPRLERAGKRCRSLEEFLQLAKPRHWTQARMRRLLVWAFLGLTQAVWPEVPPYLRVLGFNARGQELLKEMKSRAALPILTKPAHARELEEAGRRLFSLEVQCTDLYDLCLPEVPVPGREWTTGPVRL